MNQLKKKEHHVRPYKLLAQTFGLFVCGFFILFIIGEGIPDIIKGNRNELIFFLPLLLLPIAGYLVTWFNEKYGVAIMIAGAVILLGYFLGKGSVGAALIYSIPFFVSGGLFLLHLKKRGQLQHQK